MLWITQEVTQEGWFFLCCEVFMKKLIRILLLTGGLLLFVYISLYTFFVNFNWGALLLAGIAGVMLLYGLFYSKLIRLRWLNLGILVVSALYAVMLIFMGVYGNNDTVTYEEDAVIVLGAGIFGEYVPPVLAERLDRALAYSRQNPQALLILSGGQGPGEYITEALAMERYLVQRGVSVERIIKEEQSTSTYENLLFSKKILDDHFTHQYQTAVITNGFHIYRTSKTAASLGLEVTHCHAKTYLSSVPMNYARESMAVGKMWLQVIW
jgi:uncharacterized SAM-binding protein YcdF (DUF218 family)